MRQKGDKTFIDFLNLIRAHECFEDNTKQLQLRKIDLNSIPVDATIIFPENKPKDECKQVKSIKNQSKSL